jgi:cell division protein FtsQ
MLSWPRRLALVLAVAVALAAGYFLWLRDSSLVEVRDVRIEGLSGPESGRISAALTEAGQEMTSLHVRPELLERAVAPFPTVESVSADGVLFHGLNIEVVERSPVLLVRSGGREVSVAADGTLLPQLGGSGSRELPVITVEELPGSGMLSGRALDQALVVGAAPAPLRALIEAVGHSEDEGVEVVLEGGIEVRFGAGERAGRKWVAAAAVLADPRLEGLTYLDVRVPERPAVGTL